MFEDEYREMKVGGWAGGWVGGWVGGRVGGWAGWWVGGWLGGWVGGRVGGWVGGWVGERVGGWVSGWSWVGGRAGGFWLGGWLGGLVGGLAGEWVGGHGACGAVVIFRGSAGHRLWQYDSTAYTSRYKTVWWGERRRVGGVADAPPERRVPDDGRVDPSRPDRHAPHRHPVQQAPALRRGGARTHGTWSRPTETRSVKSDFHLHVPTTLGKEQGAKEIGHNLARERPKFGHNLVRKRHKIFYARTTKIWFCGRLMKTWAQICKHFTSIFTLAV